MPRPVAASVAHPSSRFKDKIRLRQGRRGPSDLIWSATFKLDGKWLSQKPINLGTPDFDEACEVARDKFAAMNGGGIEAIIRPYAKAKPAPVPPTVPNRFASFAETAIAKLETQAATADAAATGKGHNFRALVRRIQRDLLPRWGDTKITTLT
jgi:hypothetical protein